MIRKVHRAVIGEFYYRWKRSATVAVLHPQFFRIAVVCPGFSLALGMHTLNSPT